MQRPVQSGRDYSDFMEAESVELLEILIVGNVEVSLMTSLSPNYVSTPPAHDYETRTLEALQKQLIKLDSAFNK